MEWHYIDAARKSPRGGSIEESFYSKMLDSFVDEGEASRTSTARERRSMRVMQTGMFGNQGLTREQKRTVLKLKYKMWKNSELQLAAQYFIVIATLSTFESLEDILSYIPFYYTLKFMFLGYLLFPELKGGEIMYFEAILPIMANENIELSIDDALEKLDRATLFVINIFSSPINAIVSLVSFIHQNLVIRPIKAIRDFFQRMRDRIGRRIDATVDYVRETRRSTRRKISNVYNSIVNTIFFWRRWTRSTAQQNENEIQQNNIDPNMNEGAVRGNTTARRQRGGVRENTTPRGGVRGNTTARGGVRGNTTARGGVRGNTTARGGVKTRSRKAKDILLRMGGITAPTG